MQTSIALALLSGVLYVFSFAPWDQAWLQWFAFLPLFFALDRLPAPERTLRRLLLVSLIPAAVICIGGFYWVVHATRAYGGLPLPAALSLFALFTLTGQLQIPLFMALRRELLSSGIPGRFPFLFAVFSGVLYAGIESLYPKLFLDTAGHAFYRSSWIRQAADLGGPFLLTTLVIAVNELWYLALRTRVLRPAFYSLAVILALCGYGQMRVTQYETLKTAAAGGPVFRTAMIQANIGDYLKIAAEGGGMDAAEQVMDRYLGLSALALKSEAKPDAVIWPETAFPALFQRPSTRSEERMQERFDQLLSQSDSRFIFGGYDYDERSREEFNSLYFYDPRDGTKSVYHKNILLLFGETLPLADSFPSMKSWFPTMGFFGRGPGPEIHTAKNREGVEFRFAPSICYEGLFSDHSAQGALQGADALLNVTNDSWFGEQGEPHLHLALTRFRTIETRLPLLRSTNTGITIFVDPTGDSGRSTGIYQEDILQAEIPKRLMPAPPFLILAGVFGGNWYARLCQLLTLGFVAVLFSRRKI